MRLLLLIHIPTQIHSLHLGNNFRHFILIMNRLRGRYMRQVFSKALLWEERIEGHMEGGMGWWCRTAAAVTFPHGRLLLISPTQRSSTPLIIIIIISTLLLLLHPFNNNIFVIITLPSHSARIAELACSLRQFNRDPHSIPFVTPSSAFLLIQQFIPLITYEHTTSIPKTNFSNITSCLSPPLKELFTWAAEAAAAVEKVPLSHAIVQSTTKTTGNRIEI